MLTALIPARGGSKGIPRKNIKDFGGKPLIQWTIDAALSVNIIDKVIVSTEDEEISEIALSLGAEVPFLRPEIYSTDFASSIEVANHLLNYDKSISELLLLQPTSPLRNSAHISDFLKYAFQNGLDSVISVTESSKPVEWLYRLDIDNSLIPIFEKKLSYQRQLLKKNYFPNGAMYLASRDFINQEHSFVSNKTKGFIMDKIYSVDLDNPIDWIWGEFLLEKVFNH